MESSFSYTVLRQDVQSESTMLHSNGKNHIVSDDFLSILLGRGDVLDLVWVVSSDGENIVSTYKGTYLKNVDTQYKLII